MESLSETAWDVVICGTGLPQSLLALSLSRSGKNILHVDPNDYYGGPDAALSLQEAEEWAAANASPSSKTLFSSAVVNKPDGAEGLSSPRAYALTLSPQIIHTQSALIAQLVSSRAYRQLEFLAVGSFFVFQPASATAPASRPTPSISRIPSTREDVFSSSAIPARAKRSLMKFLKFVLDYDAEPQAELWRSRPDEPLAAFLASEFKLDAELQAYVLTLTLALDGDVTVRAGLAAIHRHLTSMGVFGPGFAAVFPKWGGGSEIAQVACRAGAVGGGIYMLGTGVNQTRETSDADGGEVEVDLSNGVTVKTKKLVRGPETGIAGQQISRLVAVIGAKLSSLFEVVVEGAPTPAVAIVAFPVGSVQSDKAVKSATPVYAIIHSGDTGECPSGQSVIYLTTAASEISTNILQRALDLLLEALANADHTPKALFLLSYDQSHGGSAMATDSNILTLPAQPPDLAFNDASIEPIRLAWSTLVPDVSGVDYMTFPDRTGVGDDNDDPGYDG